MTTAPAVMKFGGAALRDGDGVARVARIVQAAQGPRLVVASAMAGVTDALADAIPQVLRDESHVFVLVESLRDRHREAIAHACPGDAAAAYALDAGLERLERLLYGIAYTQEATPRLHDLLLSFGERLCAPMVAAAIRARGGDAVALDAERAGVRTRGPYGMARPDLTAMRETTGQALVPLLEAGKVPVVTGFYGVDPDGNATLLGRGGSDHVATLLGHALGAARVELWKDVPGFLTADPVAVPDARLVPELHYDEAAELAHFGAKVLHARAVEPAAEAGIPIHIRCVHTPEAAGTVIHAAAPASVPVRSIACQDGLAVVRLRGPGMGETPGVAGRIFARLGEAGVNVRAMAASQASLALVVDGADGNNARALLQGLSGGVIHHVDLLPDRSLVCVVGRGLGASAGSAARVLAAAGAGIEVISLGASSLALDFVVARDDRPGAVRRIHAMEEP